MLEEVPRRLADLLGLPAGRVRVRKSNLLRRGKREDVDMIVVAGPHLFVVECKAAGTAAPVSAAAQQLRAHLEKSKTKAIPLVVSQFMGEVGRKLSEDLGVGWMDLSGNAGIKAPGLNIHIQGHPNRFKRPGRPSSLFAPKSARVTRWLLMHPDRSFAQREMAAAIEMDEGFVSRVVRGLEQQELVVRESNGRVRVRDFDVLLNAWHEAYDFSKHDILRGHIAARSSEDLFKSLGETLEREGIRAAATGLAGAWLLTHFAGFRRITFYVDRHLNDAVRRKLGFHEEQAGENVWLVVPNDAGVFHGARRHEGIECVHPVQAYLDLKGQPERAREAAEHLRKELLVRRGNA